MQNLHKYALLQPYRTQHRRLSFERSGRNRKSPYIPLIYSCRAAAFNVVEDVEGL